ncbi:nuclear transport factor 2 family protein [Streptomyces sp. NPDC048179]|uniref:nuclear transport factor 2 family protein n=1 Tax=Streptomyces sp. NPDC048179 TaxID=3365506 RepID=UPI003717584D
MIGRKRVRVRGEGFRGRGRRGGEAVAVGPERARARPGAGDLAALRATLAPDVEWTEMAGFPLAGTYRTPEGVTAHVMERLGEEWDGWTAHDDTYVVDGENVVVLARYTAVNRATGRPVDVRVAHHFVVRGGLIVRFEQFVDTALVRAAMPG